MFDYGSFEEPKLSQPLVAKIADITENHIRVHWTQLYDIDELCRELCDQLNVEIEDLTDEQIITFAMVSAAGDTVADIEGDIEPYVATEGGQRIY